MALRQAIENHLRFGEPLERQASMVIRGAPIDSEGLRRNAHATSRRNTRAGEPFVAISAEMTIAGWTLELILAPYELAGPTPQCVQGWCSTPCELPATFSAPHYSVVLPSYDVETTQLLSSSFGEAQRTICFGRSDPA